MSYVYEAYDVNGNYFTFKFWYDTILVSKEKLPRSPNQEGLIFKYRKVGTEQWKFTRPQETNYLSGFVNE